MNRLEIGAATALTGAAIFSVHNVYTQHAGSLSDVRDAPPRDPGTMQHLIDADCLAGGMVLIVGGALAIGTGKVYPLGLAVAALALVAGYYHYACASHMVTTTEGE